VCVVLCRLAEVCVGVEIQSVLVYKLTSVKLPAASASPHPHPHHRHHQSRVINSLRSSSGVTHHHDYTLNYLAARTSSPAAAAAATLSPVTAAADLFQVGLTALGIKINKTGYFCQMTIEFQNFVTDRLTS